MSPPPSTRFYKVLRSESRDGETRLRLACRCFRPVSRTEAEVLLERHPDCGNMLLRPGRDGCSLAVTTRQDLNG